MVKDTLKSAIPSSQRLCPSPDPGNWGSELSRGPGRASRRAEYGYTARARSVCILVLAAGLASAPAGSAPHQSGPEGLTYFQCRNEPSYRMPLSELSAPLTGVRAFTVEGWFELIPGIPPRRMDRYFLKDDEGLGGRVELRPYAEWEGGFRDLGRTLMGRRLEVTGCLGPAAPEPGAEPRGREWNEAEVALHFYQYLEITGPDRERPPREVELPSLRDGAFEGQRVRLRGVLGGREHAALPLSTRLSDSDWVLASGSAATWMRDRPPEGDGFSLDPGDADDRGLGLAVVGVVAWWRGAPSLHVESVALNGPRPRSTVVVLFTLPLDRRLDAAGQTIEVRFNAAMDKRSFEGRVELVDASGEPVPARWAYDDSFWGLLVSPATAAGAGEELVLRLRAGIRSLEGHGVRPEAEAVEGLLLERRFRVSEEPMTFNGRRTNKPVLQKLRDNRGRCIKRGDPDGIRTRVAALKGPSPGPLDDGVVRRRKGQFNTALRGRERSSQWARRPSSSRARASGR
jgi:hypothetical protein